MIKEEWHASGFCWRIPPAPEARNVYSQLGDSYPSSGGAICALCRSSGAGDNSLPIPINITILRSEETISSSTDSPANSGSMRSQARAKIHNRITHRKEMTMSRIKTISIICFLFLTTSIFSSIVNPQTAANKAAKSVQEGESEQTMHALLN